MTRKDAERLNDEFVRCFGGTSEIDEVTSGQFRFSIYSPRFTGVPHLRRQDLAWEVIDRMMTPEQILDLTLVLTYAPEDVQLVPNL